MTDRLRIGLFGGGNSNKTSITLQFVRGEYTDGYITKQSKMILPKIYKLMAEIYV